ncbi:MAG: transposase [Burkholderiaceae bacterium]|nr:transposase [Burkholderiaceae bacterium]
MTHDYNYTPIIRAQPIVANRLHAELLAFLRPFAAYLAARLDLRLVQTSLDLVQVILTHRHRALGLLLSELGGYLLSPAQAPAGTKRIHHLLHAAGWEADECLTLVWQQADARVQTLVQAGELALVLWDGSVWEKPESQASPDWGAVRSAKARRLARRRKGLTMPHQGPPILVPGLHWLGVAVVGMRGAPTVAHLAWWTTRGPHATTQRAVEQALLARTAQAWGRQVWHIWDRGYAGSAWIQAALAASVRFVVRWKKRNHLRDAEGTERRASVIGRSVRSVVYRYLRDPRTKAVIKVGAAATRVTLCDHAQPLWLVIARLGRGRDPWYLLTAEPVAEPAQLWAVIDAYARRWQIELVWRFSKSELAFESPRVWTWEVRQKLLVLATLAYAFLVHLLHSSFDTLRALVLRNWGHRTGRRYQEVAAPLYRLRAAISRLWLSAPPPGYHGPLLNSG